MLKFLDNLVFAIMILGFVYIIHLTVFPTVLPTFYPSLVEYVAALIS